MKSHDYLTPQNIETGMPLTSLILAGGQGRRLGGRDKALLLLDGKPLLSLIADKLRPVSSEIIISLRDRTQADSLPLPPDCEVVFDRYPDCGPLSGMLSGFRETGGEYVFVTACDMPFVNTAVIEFLFAEARGHAAALIRREDGRLQSLYGVYNARKLIPAIEDALAAGGNKILAPVFELDDTVEVDISRIREIDPDLQCLININTKEDLAKYGLSWP
jgi:molybdopterin-guanine dinucleotide biosynthesis protein A